jgi:hypothetical protein
MPFQEFTRFFNSAELNAMTAAYKGAMRQLVSNAAVCHHPLEDLKARLTNVILAAACSGKRDKERLEDAALRAGRTAACTCEPPKTQMRLGQCDSTIKHQGGSF